MEKLRTIQSICPECHRVLTGEYVLDGEKVVIKKTCPEHGEMTNLIANNAEDYIKWMETPVVNIPPKQAMTEGVEGECPLHCGTCEHHLQTACCVLIDLTERCNQMCPFCFASSKGSGTDVPIEEIEKKYDLLIKLGEERPFNIQLSGGEPTVRDDLPEIIRMGRDKGFEYIQINSNGRRIAEEPGYAKKLKDAGASVIFMQFDGMNDDIYMKLRNEPLLATKLKAIENCRRAGLPVTLVPTVVKNVNLDNIGEMMRFMIKNIDVVKGIHFQPVSFFGRIPGSENKVKGEFDNRVTMFDCMHEIEKQTDGMFKYEDLCPISTGHPLCCFYGTYVKEPDGEIKSLISDATRKKGIGCCESADPLEIIRKDRDFVLNKWEMPEYDDDEECCCCGDAEPTEETECCCCGDAEPAEETECCCCGDAEPSEETECCCCGDAELTEETECCCCGDAEYSDSMDLDEFLSYYRRNTFTVSGMAFMDQNNLDAERLKRCRVQVLDESNRLIPFCAYNSIYRK